MKIWLGMFCVISLNLHVLGDDAYNPPITQADDTASEMGRQNDENNQRNLDRLQKMGDENLAENRNRAMSNRVDMLEAEISEMKTGMHTLNQGNGFLLQRIKDLEGEVAGLRKEEDLDSKLLMKIVERLGPPKR